jgi:threonine/homoserine/homoserine lactone efflux protein
MPGLDLLIPFAMATAVFAYFPGPALLYSAAQTLAGGRRAGFLAALGLHLGCYLHVLATALGLSAILGYVPELYLALKLAGAAYLVWLGVGMWRHNTVSAVDVSQVDPSHAGTNHAGRGKTRKRALTESMIVEILNPKTALFFIAFLPQFVDPTAALPLSVQLLILGTIVNLVFSSADLIAIVLTDRVVRSVGHTGFGMRIARALGGTVLIGLGLRLALWRD